MTQPTTTEEGRVQEVIDCRLDHRSPVAYKRYVKKPDGSLETQISNDGKHWAISNRIWPLFNDGGNR